MTEVIHIIHDYRRTDRREKFEAELASQNVMGCIWPAIQHERPRTGVSLAHKQIIQWAKDHELPEIKIGEDDLKFLGEGSFKRFLDTKPKDFDIFTAGTYCGEVEAENRAYRFCGTHLYIVNCRFYDTMLEANEEEHIDQWLRGKGKFIVCVPFAALQYDDYSDNVGRIHRRDHLLKRYKNLIPE